MTILHLCDKRRALLASNGALVVRGGAGSGKTTIALAKASADIEAGKLGSAGKALFLSFARATVARVAEQALKEFRAHRGRIEINTYHGFAWTVLKSHAYLIGTRPGVSLLLPALARTRLAGLRGDARSERQYQLFEQDGLLAFDLFTPLVTDIFTRCPVLAKAYAAAYPLIIVDEFQDTNADEWAMIRCIGQHTRLIALGDPKQRIYDFKGADPKRFDEFIETFAPEKFDFESENRRSAGTDITAFADDILTGTFSRAAYAGVKIQQFGGKHGVRALKETVLSAAVRLRRGASNWSLAVLVPTNTLAVNVWDELLTPGQGLPRCPSEIVVSAEGPMLAGRIIAMLLEPFVHEAERAAVFLEGLAAFQVGRDEEASATALTSATKLQSLANAVRERGLAALDRRGIGTDVAALLRNVLALELKGAPFEDWRAIRRLLGLSPRKEIQQAAKEARHLRLLQRGAQIDAHFGDAWRTHGCYKGARELLDAALVEDQFAATTRTQRGVTVMTIHKAKGKEFDEVIVFENTYQRYHWAQDERALRAARFNLHVAVTRARKSATIFTPKREPSPLLP